MWINYSIEEILCEKNYLVWIYEDLDEFHYQSLFPIINWDNVNIWNISEFICKIEKSTNKNKFFRIVPKKLSWDWNNEIYEIQLKSICLQW